MGFHWDVFVPCCLFTSGLRRGRSSPPPPGEHGSVRGERSGKSEKFGPRGDARSAEVGHNKGSRLPFETQRESPEGSAKNGAAAPYICNPLRASPSPRSLCFPRCQAGFLSQRTSHATQISFPQLSPQVSHASFCLQSPKLTAGKQEPPGKANSGQLWSGSAVTAALGSREGLACQPHAPRKG